MSYIPPTEEELAQYDQYWTDVHTSVLLGKRVVREEISQELINKVNAHRQRENALACEHPEVSIGVNAFTCTECDQPVRMMSELQINNLMESMR